MPSPTSDASASALEQALAFVPPGAGYVSFTDWAQLKAEAGFADVTSSSPRDEHDALLSAIGSGMSRHPPYGSSMFRYLPYTAAHWGFDATDLTWELATEVARGPRLIVLRFPDSFDLQPLVDLLVERSYTAAEVDGARIYSHAQTADEWLISGPEFQNVAFLEDGRTIVLARLPVGEPDGMGAIVETILDSSAASEERSQLAMVAAALDHATGAILWLGDSLCELSTSFAPELSDQVREEIAAAQPLGRYAAWGIGYTDAHDPVGRMVFAYAGSEEAAADLAGRGQLVERGHVSMQNPPQTFADRWFSVALARTDGPSLVFELQPVNDAPGPMMALTHAFMSYATCGNPPGGSSVP